MAEGLAPDETAARLREQVIAGMVWANDRKVTFRRRSSLMKVVSVGLLAVSTVILGLQDLNLWASIAFSMIALVTVVNSLEPFFNWRSRWVLMEEAKYRSNRLRDELDYYLATTPAGEVEARKVDEFFQQWQQIWRETGLRWLEHRKGDQTEPGR